MIWLYGFIVLSVISFTLVSRNKWHSLWPSGIVSVFVLFMTDTTLVKLGAFSFAYGNALLQGLPVFYLASAFFAGIVFFNYLPEKKSLQFPYILVFSAIILVVEVIFKSYGFFYYHNWSTIRSFILNVFGLTITLEIAQWVKKVHIVLPHNK